MRGYWLLYEYHFETRVDISRNRERWERDIGPVIEMGRRCKSMCLLSKYFCTRNCRSFHRRAIRFHRCFWVSNLSKRILGRAVNSWCPLSTDYTEIYPRKLILCLSIWVLVVSLSLKNHCTITCFYRFLLALHRVFPVIRLIILQ